MFHNLESSKNFFRGWFRISNSPPHSRPDSEAAYKTPPFRTERKGGVSVGKTVVDYFQGYARSEQTLPGSFLPYKGRIVFEVLFCHFPFAIELVMLGTHFVIGRTIQFQPVYACLNLLLQRGRQLRVGKNMPAYKFQIKPTILDFKRIENIREVPFAAVYCGTGQTVIAPFSTVSTPVPSQTRTETGTRIWGVSLGTAIPRTAVLCICPIAVIRGHWKIIPTLFLLESLDT